MKRNKLKYMINNIPAWFEDISYNIKNWWSDNKEIIPLIFKYKARNVTFYDIRHKYYWDYVFDKPASLLNIICRMKGHPKGLSSYNAGWYDDLDIGYSCDICGEEG